MIASIAAQPLEIRETIVTQTFPLLPYLFFDSASASLPAKYTSKMSASSFDEKVLPKQTLPIYYAMLDVIGKRMTTNTSATLSITGTTDGIELKTPAERKALAERRARTIAQHMQDRWGIAPGRFIIRTADRPALESNESYLEGVEENRRVEIASNDASLLAPVVHSRFNEYVPVQSVHDFAVTVRNPQLASAWNLDVFHQQKQVGQRTGTMAPPTTVTFRLDQEMTDRLGPVVGNVDTLDARMSIAQTSGTPVDASTRFPLRKTISNYEVSRLSLIVFDYDRAEISQANREMMQRVISSSVREGSTATIIGSTDRLGEMKHNLDLSAERARTVDAFARQIAPVLRVTDVKGVGPSVLPYDNDLPEGRFYCRTVSLTITTPLR
jgi:outer membrane protein OmpA-like peptidoglycan-associated protein